MRESLVVHLVQTTSTDNVEANWNQISSLLGEKPKGPALVCLPENCLYLRVVEGEKIEGIGFENPVWKSVQTLAKEKDWVIHLGSVPTKTDGKLTNSSVVVWPDGRSEITYRKIHLFDITLDGQKPNRESDVFSHGERPTVLPIGDWQIGQSICYDVRFSDLYHQYALQGVDLILVPASFLVTTGKAHWEILLRARAIESQAFVVAAAQAGTHRSDRTQSERQTYGHSLIINPWGQILAHGSADKAEVLTVTLQRGEIERVRRQIPMAGHRRLHRIGQQNS